MEDDSMNKIKDIHAKLVEAYPIMKPMCDMYEVIVEQAFREQDASGGDVSVTTSIILHNVEKLFEDSLVAAKMTKLFTEGDIEKVLENLGVDLSAVMGEDDDTTKDDSGENKVIPFPNKLH